jgi:hypothetical protein
MWKTPYRSAYIRPGFLYTEQRLTLGTTSLHPYIHTLFALRDLDFGHEPVSL